MGVPAESAPAAPEPKPMAKDDEEPLPPPPTAAQMEQAEQLLRQARLAKSRGQTAQATQFLKQAEGIAPGSASVLEFIGDEFVERSQFKNARAVYGKALRIAPKNVQIETKYATCVLKTEGSSFAAMQSELEVVANAKVALILSVLIPGGGQIVLGEIYKGVAMFVCYVGAWIWAIKTPNGLDGLFAMMGGKGGTALGIHLNMVVFIPLAIAAIIHISSIAGAGSKAKEKKLPPPPRPTPPADLPFE